MRNARILPQKTLEIRKKEIAQYILMDLSLAIRLYSINIFQLAKPQAKN